MNLPDTLMEQTSFMINGPMRIYKAFCIGPVPNPEENDYLNIDPKLIFNADGWCEEDLTITLRNGIKSPVFFYDTLTQDRIGFDFHRFPLPAHERIFLVTDLECPEATEALFRIGGTCRTKIWVNHLPIYNGTVSMVDSYLMLFPLRAGKNRIMAEVGRSEEGSCVFSIRVNRLQDDLEGIEGKIVGDSLAFTVNKQMQPVQAPFVMDQKPDREFLLIPHDYIHLPVEQTIFVTVKNAAGERLDQFALAPLERYRYDFRSLKDRPDASFLACDLHFTDYEGNQHQQELVFLIDSLTTQMESLKSEYEILQRDFQMDEEDRLNLEGRIHDLDKSNIIEIAWRETKAFFEIAGYIKRGLHFGDYLKDHGAAVIYFKSRLDQKPSRYNIYVPSAFAPGTKYPLVIFSTYDYSSGLVFNYEQILRGPYIMAEIPDRGVMCGSYVSEASFLEILGILKATYPIDEDRISLLGYSHGAFATWALAQAHPYLFAGIAPISGLPYVPNLKNLMNTAILNIVGERDILYEFGYRVPTSVLQEINPRYQGVLMRETSHSIIFAFWGKYIIEWLLEQRRPPYPQKIHLRTERLRHNRTHWAEVLEMEPAAGECELEGEIVDSGTINLTLRNVRRLLITLPGEDKEYMLQVNGKAVTMQHDFIVGNQCLLEKDGEDYVPGDMVSFVRSAPSSKGMGILDLYLEHTIIIIPSTYDSIAEERQAKLIADTFARPETNGWDHNAHIDYPVLTEGSISINELMRSSMILIGTKTSSRLLTEIKERLPFKFIEDGIEYQGKEIKGEYYFFLVTTNPWNPEKKALIIYASHYTMWQKDVLTRKVVIPSYSNGLHPYLNHEAIIYDGKKHYLIRSIGEAMVESV